MVENIIILALLSILYILLFGEPGYVITNIELENKVNESENKIESEEDVEYDDNNLDDEEIDSVDDVEWYSDSE